MPKKTGKNVTRLPSDTPTALLAPSDFEHIYRDPTVGGTKAPKVKKMNRTASVKASGSKMTRNQSTQKTGSASSSSAQEVLPVSILNVVKKFVDKQKKTYTINKWADFGWFVYPFVCTLFALFIFKTIIKFLKLFVTCNIFLLWFILSMLNFCYNFIPQGHLLFQWRSSLTEVRKSETMLVMFIHCFFLTG